VISTGRVKDGMPLRGRPPGVHTGTRGRPPLHGVKYPASAVDDTSSLHYKVCSKIICHSLLILPQLGGRYSFDHRLFVFVSVCGQSN